MRFTRQALYFALLMLTLTLTLSAQTPRSELDPRNTAPTVGTGGPMGGPTGLFTVYDGQTLRRGEFTFSIAYSNFDRDPGDVDIVEVPVSFQIGLSDNLELFFNTDAYRAVKVNSPRNLSGFYLPNSQLDLGGGLIGTPPAIILAPLGPNALPFPLGSLALFRPATTTGFTAFPFVGGSLGSFGLPTFDAPLFGDRRGPGPFLGFPNFTFPIIGAPVASSGSGADLFPGVGSIYGGILPGVVLQTGIITPGILPPGNTQANTIIPTVFTTAPSYLPDAPFVNRTFGESAFSTFTIGAKWRFTGANNPFGIGIIPFYRFYADKADDAGGFNQLQRGSSAGGGGLLRGDVGLTLFIDDRIYKWLNVSGNFGFIYNSDVKGDFGGSESVTLLDRPNEFQYAVGLDFPVNKHFQPILEFRGTRYVGGRTPNAFENHPLDGVAGARFFLTRWLGFGAAYRYNFNQQDASWLENNDRSSTDAVTVLQQPRIFVPLSLEIPQPPILVASTGNFASAFRPSSDPHGFILQAFIGRRNARAPGEILNQPANVTGLDLDRSEVFLPCPPGTRSTSETRCSDDMTVGVRTTAVDPENDVLTYSYTVSGGRIVGTGANVSWDLSGVRAGTYTITAAVDDACGFCGQTQTRTVTVRDCPGCVPVCNCPTLSVSASPGTVGPGDTITFTANVSGGDAGAVTSYNWTVSSGSIVEGQGTPTIRVATTSDMGGQNVRAEVTISGLDPNCNCTTTAAETAGVTTAPLARLITEIGAAPADQIKNRADELATELNTDPSATGVIINYGTPAQVRARERLIRTYLTTNRGIDPSRLTFVNGGPGPIRTQFYIVPAGATPPTPGM